MGFKRKIWITNNPQFGQTSSKDTIIKCFLLKTLERSAFEKNNRLELVALLMGLNYFLSRLGRMLKTQKESSTE